uniref:Oxidoreductase molybdopterin-binding domain-containing protein n=1 Tax=Arcella intermedia TaxID=1963864 RepID=A0A6B2L644_9EUKA
MYQIGADGYTTNAPREVFDKEDVFLAWEVNGEPIPEEHGYIRLINPMLYGSKSAKFVSEIHFMEKEEKGFWELRGVHDRGNVMLEERYNKKKRDNTSLEEVQRIIQECKEKLQIELDLSGFGLEEIPEEVFELTHIRTLLLFNNNLKTFPEKLSKLTNLQTLSVNANKLTEIPPVVSMLPELNELWMCDNKVTHLPKHLLDAPELSVLGIESNMLEELPEWISEVPSLTILFADLNRIKRIPRQIGDRPWGALLFNGNPVEFVPTELSKQKDIIFLGFYGCSLFPSEVLEEGTKGILAFLEKGDLGH